MAAGPIRDSEGHAWACASQDRRQAWRPWGACRGLRPLPARPGIWAGWRLAERQPGSQQAVAAVYLEKSIQRRYKTSKTERISTRTGIAQWSNATGMEAMPATRGNAMPQCGGQVKQEGHRADALALRADERRDKLRKAAGRGTCPVIRRCLNGETHMGEAPMYPCANT